MMKTAISFRFILSAAILACVLIGERSLEYSFAQTQPAPPSDASAVSTDNASASDLAPDVDPNSPLGQIVRLVQAGVEQSVILNYINNSTDFFNLDADKIIYLNDLGVPTEIIDAMIRHDQQLEQTGAAPSQPAQSVETTGTTAQPAEVTVNYFYSTLAPYGVWVNVVGYGWCWRPTVVIYNTSWQPYCDNGHWVYTDNGWFWMSGYSWGWATFHYGRWFRIPRYGWCWWPDTTWAPSWVCWRYNKDYCGWAPLPPHAVYRTGVGLVYQGHTVRAGFHFSLGVSAYTFVPIRNFHDSHPWRHRVGEKEATRIYDHTTPFHRMDFDHHNQAIVNPGIPPRDITAVTKQPIHPVAVQYEGGRTVHGERHDRFERDGRTLVVHRPHFVGSPVLSLHPGTTSATERRQNGFHPSVHRNENNSVRPPSNPAQNNFQHRESNQNTHQNFNQGAPQTHQTTPRQNGIRPNYYRRNNGISSHPRNTQQNNLQHSEYNRTPNPNLNHAAPPTPRVVTPRPQQHNDTITAPHQNYSPRPSQSQAPDVRYHYGNEVLSPRARGFEQQSPSHVFHGPAQRSGAVDERQTSVPRENRYSPRAGQQQNQSHYSVPRNQPRNHVQRFNHSEPQQRALAPHTSSQSSRSSSQPYSQQGYDKSNDRRVH